MGNRFRLATFRRGFARVRSSLFYTLLAVPLTVLAATQVVALQRDSTGGLLYPLLWANIVLIVVMSALIVVAAIRFWRRWRKGDGGSRLAARLAGWFLAVAFLPAGALYLVSAHGVFRGIESWFETPLGDAFNKGEEFGKHVLGLEFNRLVRDARNLANALNGAQPLFWRDDLQLLYQLDDIVIYDKNGTPAPGYAGAGDPLSQPALNDLRRGNTYLRVADGKPRLLEVVLRLPHRRSGYALKASRTLPEDIDEGIAEVERGRREYQNLLILRRGLLFSFMTTLTLAFVIALALSLRTSIYLGAKFFRPLTRMARAATTVGRGDFSRRLPVGDHNDEIAELSRAFNAMVDDLQLSRRQIGERQTALSAANAYLENLLASMTSGVLTVDANGKLTRFNQTAETMLGTPMRNFIGKHYSQWKTPPQIASMIDEVMCGDANLERRMPLKDGRTLVIRLRRLPPACGSGALIVADDISDQIQTEREIVWEEASRRFAHEIRNPLTPIQLASERMQTKLSPKLQGEDKQILQRLSTTIIRQVQAMQEMVDAFRLYADKKIRRHVLLDINTVAAEIAQLYERPSLQLQMQWGENLPSISGDLVLLRQALHNLLGNAVESVAAVPRPQIAISTMQQNDSVRLTVEDNGGGVPAEILHKVFDPYQTTKEKGAGLGLSIVRKIMEEHNGEAKLENTKTGVRASLIFPRPPDSPIL